MSEAYASTLHISFDVRGGLLVRQLHHWAALVFLAAMLTHMMRHFFTGSFRRPREVNWVFGWTLLLLGLFEGLFGYSLPDDLLSGTGLRFVDGRSCRCRWSARICRSSCSAGSSPAMTSWPASTPSTSC